MEKVRIGLLGLGSMGANHAQYLTRGEVPGAELAAVCDVRPERLQWAKGALGEQLLTFNDADQFLTSRAIDAVIIVVPHYHHPALAIKAFAHGLHVLIEKPAGVYTRQVREMNDAAAQSGKVFGIMYNQRTNPLYQKMRDLIQSGELGGLKRVQWTVTTWYRSQSYYDLGDWRATWAGEGGGVLLNQAPHQLDLWQWIIGMPARVRAFCQFGKYHQIEVEDEVTAYLEYENGATGLFVTSTGETPGTNRFEIHGDRGKLVAEDGKLEFWRLRTPERQFNREYQGGFGQPECWKCEVPLQGRETAHAGITANWVEAIRGGAPLLAPGAEGIRGLELSNAIYLSSWTNDWVNLPVDEELFYQQLQERIQGSAAPKNRPGQP